MLDRFSLRYRPSGTGEAFGLPFAAQAGKAVVDGFLGVWDTRGLPNGPYDLRLRVHDQMGHTHDHTITVVVDNPTPTPSPTSTSTATPTATVVSPFVPVRELPIATSAFATETPKHATLVPKTPTQAPATPVPATATRRPRRTYHRRSEPSPTATPPTAAPTDTPPPPEAPAGTAEPAPESTNEP